MTTSAEPVAESSAASPARIASIDALRGFDMFLITGGRHLMVILAGIIHKIGG
jgi:hypothetical protein